MLMTHNCSIFLARFLTTLSVLYKRLMEKSKTNDMSFNKMEFRKSLRKSLKSFMLEDAN